MSEITKIVIALSIASAATAPALAQDGPGDWTGLYGGVHAAVIDGRSSWSGQNLYNANDGPEGATVLHTETITGHDSSTDFGGGVRVGGNYQTGPLVVGIEGDITFLDQTTQVTGPSSRYVLESRLKNFETLRARAGIDAGRVLIYATGGFAWGDLKHHATTPTDLSADFSNDSGWSLGGGVEAKISDRISANLMYLYLDFGSASGSDSNTAGESIAPAASTHYSVGMLSLNYHF